MSFTQVIVSRFGRHDQIVAMLGYVKESVVQRYVRGYNALNATTTRRQRVLMLNMSKIHFSSLRCVNFDYVKATLSPRCNHVQSRFSHVVHMFFHICQRS